MTNKKFKMAAMSLALTACVAASGLAANAEAPESTAEEPAAPAMETPAEPAPVPETQAEDSPAEEPEEEAPAGETPAEEAPEEASSDADAPENKPGPEEADDEKQAVPAAETQPDAALSENVLSAEPAISRAEEPAVNPVLPAGEAAAEAPADTADRDTPQISLLVPSEGFKTAGPAASIGSTSYGTLQDAIDAANEGADVILNRDCEGFVEIVKSIILDLGGNKIIAPAGSGKAAITVDIKDSSKDAPELVIKNGTVTGGEDSGIKVIRSDVDVILDGLEITGNAGTSGGGVSAKNSTVAITDSSIHDNTATDGGGIYADSCELTVSDSTIQDNTASRAGGGIHLKASDADITGNTISGNTSGGGGGGGIYSTDPSGTAECTIDLTDNDIIHNTTSGYGGGVLIANKNQTAAINGGSISGNTALNGGGIGMTSESSITVDGTAVTDNTADSYGGGIFTNSRDRTLTLKNTAIQGNHAYAGGGVYLRGKQDKLTADSSTSITGNTADLYGGGICGESNRNFGFDQVIDLTTGTFYSNHAGLAGDDLYLPANKGSTLILRPVGSGWVLDDCGHTIDGWYLDGEGARWNADGANADLPKLASSLDALLADASVQVNDDGTFCFVTPEGHIIRKFADGHYEIQTSGTSAIALKAAHAVAAEPVPGPTDPDEPAPNPPEQPAPAQPEAPELPPVQDAQPDTPALPQQPVLPAVQDAHALPQTGTSLFAALVMALSGFALTAAGAFASLTGKNARH